MHKLSRSLLSTLLVSLSFLPAGCDSFKGSSENQEQKVQEAYISYFNAMVAVRDAGECARGCHIACRIVYFYQGFRRIRPWERSLA